MKGHDGPTGAKCHRDEDQTESDSRTTHLLVQELTKLNLAMEKMTKTQSEILQVITSSPMKAPNPASVPDGGISASVSGVGANVPAVVSSAGSIVRGAMSGVGANVQGVASGVSAVAPHVTEKTTSAAQLGEFVDLVEFLPTIHNYHGESEMYISEGNMQTRPKRTKRVIDNCYTWLMAWNIYEQVIIEKHPQMYPKLVKYRTLIQQCDRRYLWHSIYSYDVQFRAKRGAEKSFAFDELELDVTLYTTILDATSIRGGNSRQCLRCRSYDHIVRDCPFPEGTTMAETAEKKQKSQQQDKWSHRNVEGCNNFQYGRCFFAGCKRAHVCQKCRGPEPLYRCACDRGNNQIAPQSSSLGHGADRLPR